MFTYEFKCIVSIENISTLKNINCRTFGKPWNKNELWVNIKDKFLYICSTEVFIQNI